MVQVVEVARYLVHLAANCSDEPDYLTHLRLQKLLYYVQGWSLALLGRPMFSDRIEAWAHGPVVRDAYRRFADKGGRAILPSDFDETDDFALDDVERELIASVWEMLKDHSALSLRKMTHEEPPWMDAHRGYGPADLCQEEITKDAMKAYFETLAE